MADLNTEVELIKKDIGQISKLVDKFDVTIDKLQQVAVDITKIVTLQEAKIQQQDRISEDIDDEVRDVRKKTEDLEKSLSEKLSNSEKKILAEIASVKEDLNKKISSLESWRYAVMAIISVFVFILSQVTGLAKLFMN